MELEGAEQKKSLLKKVSKSFKKAKKSLRKSLSRRKSDIGTLFAENPDKARELLKSNHSVADFGVRRSFSESDSRPRVERRGTFLQDLEGDSTEHPGTLGSDRHDGSDGRAVKTAVSEGWTEPDTLDSSDSPQAVPSSAGSPKMFQSVDSATPSPKSDVASSLGKDVFPGSLLGERRKSGLGRSSFSEDAEEPVLVSTIEDEKQQTLDTEVVEVVQEAVVPEAAETADSGADVAVEVTRSIPDTKEAPVVVEDQVVDTVVEERSDAKDQGEVEDVTEPAVDTTDTGKTTEVQNVGVEEGDESVVAAPTENSTDGEEAVDDPVVGSKPVEDVGDVPVDGTSEEDLVVEAPEDVADEVVEEETPEVVVSDKASPMEKNAEKVAEEVEEMKDPEITMDEIDVPKDEIDVSKADSLTDGVVGKAEDIAEESTPSDAPAPEDISGEVEEAKLTDEATEQHNVATEESIPADDVQPEVDAVEADLIVPEVKAEIEKNMDETPSEEVVVTKEVEAEVVVTKEADTQAVQDEVEEVVIQKEEQFEEEEVVEEDQSEDESLEVLHEESEEDEVLDVIPEGAPLEQPIFELADSVSSIPTDEMLNTNRSAPEPESHNSEEIVADEGVPSAVETDENPVADGQPQPEVIKEIYVGDVASKQTREFSLADVEKMREKRNSCSLVDEGKRLCVMQAGQGRHSADVGEFQIQEDIVIDKAEEPRKRWRWVRRVVGPVTVITGAVIIGISKIA